MCGQAGAFSTTSLSQYEIDKVLKLLVLNSFRGTDSTGAMWYHRNRIEKNRYGTLKREVHPFYFEQITYPLEIDKEVFSGKVGLPHLFSIHCRAATIGKVTEANAHPFHHEHIIGMHNGSIHGDFANKDKFGTDSEALFHNIATMGVDEAIKDLPTSAAYALVFLDTKANTLNFLRNSQRPLHVYHNGTTIYWSSENKDLRYTFYDSMSTTTTKTTTGITRQTPLYFENDTLYTVDLKSSSGEIEWDTRVIKPTIKYTSGWHQPGGTWKNGHFFPEKEIGTGPTSSIVGSSPKTPTTATNTSGTANRNGGTRNGSTFPAWAYEAVDLSYMAQPLSAFQALGVYVKSGYNGPLFFSIELDMYFAPQAYATLCLWRICNRKEFLEAVTKEWGMKTKAQQRAALIQAGLSRQEMKTLLKGYTSCSYIDKPYVLDENHDKVYLTFLPSEILKAQDAKRKAHLTETPADKPNFVLIEGGKAAQQREDAIDGVDDGEVPFNDGIPFSLGGAFCEWDPAVNSFIYDYGVNATGTRQEISEILRCGCLWCSDASDFADLIDLFWINNDQYLCVICQDGVVDGHIQKEMIPRHQYLPGHIRMRKERDDELVVASNQQVH